MNTNMMELNMNEMEQVNGGTTDPEYKIKAVGTMTATGAMMGAITGAGLGSWVPVIGTLVGGAIGTIVGAAIGGGTVAIGYLITED